MCLLKYSDITNWVGFCNVSNFKSYPFKMYLEQNFLEIRIQIVPIIKYTSTCTFSKYNLILKVVDFFWISYFNAKLNKNQTSTTTTKNRDGNPFLLPSFYLVDDGECSK